MVKLFLRVYFSEIDTNNRCILVTVSGEVAPTHTLKGDLGPDN